MVLTGHSNALYLSESNARSRAGGHFFMSKNTTKPPNNGAILTTAQIIKAVMSLAAEAEVSRIHGASSTSNTNANGQHYSIWCCQQQHSQKNKIDGHELPLAPRQNFLRTIPTLLGPWQREQWQLRDQTSCPHPSPSHTPNFSHTINCFTSTTNSALKPTSCSKGVLDIQ